MEQTTTENIHDYDNKEFNVMDGVIVSLIFPVVLQGGRSARPHDLPQSYISHSTRNLATFVSLWATFSAEAFRCLIVMHWGHLELGKTEEADEGNKADEGEDEVEEDYNLCTSFAVQISVDRIKILNCIWHSTNNSLFVISGYHTHIGGCVAVWYKQCKSRRCWEVKLASREVSKDL